VFVPVSLTRLLRFNGWLWVSLRDVDRGISDPHWGGRCIVYRLSSIVYRLSLLRQQAARYATVDDLVNLVRHWTTNSPNLRQL
jgi:hypothetical protein